MVTVERCRHPPSVPSRTLLGNVISPCSGTYNAYTTYRIHRAVEVGFLRARLIISTSGWLLWLFTRSTAIVHGKSGPDLLAIKGFREPVPDEPMRIRWGFLLILTILVSIPIPTSGRHIIRKKIRSAKYYKSMQTLEKL